MSSARQCCPTLPADNIWNTRVDQLPVHPLSASYMASIGNSVGLHPDFGTVYNGAPNGIPFVTVPGSQPQMAAGTPAPVPSSPSHPTHCGPAAGPPPTPPRPQPPPPPSPTTNSMPPPTPPPSP